MESPDGPRTISRRALVAAAAKIGAGGALALAVAEGAGGWRTLAQGATPALAANDLGIQELKIAASETAFAGVPASLAAGRYLLTFTNGGRADAGVNFLQLPQGLTLADFAALVRQAGGDPAAAGSASPGAEESPAAGEGGGAPPPWYYQTYLAGGVGAGAGQTAQAIVDLRAGSYAVWGNDPSAPQAPMGLTVSGGLGAGPAAEPKADVTVTEIATADGFAFQLTGALKAGRQLVKIYNNSGQPHFVDLGKSPVPLTKDQLRRLLEQPPDATPAPGLPKFQDVQHVAFTTPQSAGTTTWLVVDLSPGTYFIACFVQDPNHGGMPHAFEGMAEVLTVG